MRNCARTGTGDRGERFERLLPGIFSHILFAWTVLMMFRLWGPSI